MNTKVFWYFRSRQWVQSQYRETFPSYKKVGEERRKRSGLILCGIQVLVTHYLLWALKNTLEQRFKLGAAGSGRKCANHCVILPPLGPPPPLPQVGIV